MEYIHRFFSGQTSIATDVGRERTRRRITRFRNRPRTFRLADHRRSPKTRAWLTRFVRVTHNGIFRFENTISAGHLPEWWPRVRAAFSRPKAVCPYPSPGTRETAG